MARRSSPSTRQRRPRRAPGDGPTRPTSAHYLLIAESIVADGDLDLRDEYRRARLERLLRRRRSRRWAARATGRLDEPQGIGFPLLIAPAYALGGPARRRAVPRGHRRARRSCSPSALAPPARARALGDGAARSSIGLSPPALAYATTIAPEWRRRAALLAGAAVLALRVRDRPRLARPSGRALRWPLAPWLAVEVLRRGAIVALAVGALAAPPRAAGVAGLWRSRSCSSRWCSTCRVNARLYGGLTPVRRRLARAASATGADSLADHLERWPRLVGLWIDRDVGLLRWAPLARSRSAACGCCGARAASALARAVPERRSTSRWPPLFLALVCAARVFVAAFLAPTIAGPWFAGRELVAGAARRARRSPPGACATRRGPARRSRR